MQIIKTKIRDVFIIEPKVFGDARGWFTETWSKKDMEAAGLSYDFVQDNHSFSEKKGTLRGLHFQRGEAAQAKLVRCTRGTLLDVAVDLRKNSPTYLNYVMAELSAENHRQFLIPKGLAHGFLTLTEQVEFLYKVDHPYDPDVEAGIRWNDPDLKIPWGISNPTLAEKDKNAPFFKDIKLDF